MGQPSKLIFFGGIEIMRTTFATFFATVVIFAFALNLAAVEDPEKDPTHKHGFKGYDHIFGKADFNYTTKCTRDEGVSLGGTVNYFLNFTPDDFGFVDVDYFALHYSDRLGRSHLNLIDLTKMGKRPVYDGGMVESDQGEAQVSFIEFFVKESTYRTIYYKVSRVEFEGYKFHLNIRDGSTDAELDYTCRPYDYSAGGGSDVPR